MVNEMVSVFFILLSIGLIQADETVAIESNSLNKDSSTNAVEIQNSTSTVATNAENNKPIFRRPCSCTDSSICNCCTGLLPNILGLQTRNQLCSRFKYTADDVGLEISLTLNTEQLFSTKVSGRNPPPVCLPIPRFTNLRFCLRMANVTLTERTLYFCPVIETQWRRDSPNEYNFRCLKMGQNGFGASNIETTVAQSNLSTTATISSTPSTSTKAVEEYDELDPNENVVSVKSSSVKPIVFDVYVQD